MKKLIIAVFLFPALAHAQVAGCKYLPEAVNPISGAKIISTAWEPIKRSHGPGLVETVRPVQAISEDGAIFLAFEHFETQYYGIPEESGILLEDTNIITKKGKFDPRLKPWVEGLENSRYIVPEGSALRITLEDRTNLVINTTEEINLASDVTMPQWGDNAEAGYRVRFGQVTLHYALDDEAIALLSNNRVADLRMDLPGGYLYFGRRNLIWDDKVITEGSMATIQGVLKCVL